MIAECVQTANCCTEHTPAMLEVGLYRINAYYITEHSHNESYMKRTSSQLRKRSQVALRQRNGSRSIGIGQKGLAEV